MGIFWSWSSDEDEDDSMSSESLEEGIASSRSESSIDRLRGTARARAKLSSRLSSTRDSLVSVLRRALESFKLASRPWVEREGPLEPDVARRSSPMKVGPRPLVGEIPWGGGSCRSGMSCRAEAAGGVIVAPLA